MVGLHKVYITCDIDGRYVNVIFCLTAPKIHFGDFRNGKICWCTFRYRTVMFCQIYRLFDHIEKSMVPTLLFIGSQRHILYITLPGVPAMLTGTWR